MRSCIVATPWDSEIESHESPFLSVYFVPLHVGVGVAGAEDGLVRVAVELLSNGQHGNEVIQRRLSCGAADRKVGFGLRGYLEKWQEDV